MFFFKNKIISILFIVFCLPHIAAAETTTEYIAAYSETQASSWVKTEGGTARILLSQVENPQDKDNTIFHGVIEIDLQEGWKTYWRNPGPSGMAPSFAFKQKVAYQLFFLAPTLIQSEEAQESEDWSFGYHGNVLIPFEVKVPTSAQELSGSLTIGICKTICMPVDVPFDFKLDAQENLYENNALSQVVAKAWASKPMLTNANFKIIKVEQKKDILLITLRHPESEETPELFLDGGTTEFGIAKNQSKKADETLYQVPIIYQSSKWDGTFFYTAKGAHTSFSGEAALK